MGQNTIVDLSGRDLSEMPDSVFSKADGVTELRIGSSGTEYRITSPMTSLVGTSVDKRNYLKQLPSKIDLLVNLKILDASFNDLTTLPNEFYSLVSIEEINLNHNDKFDLSSIGQSFSRLKNLKRLYLLGINFKAFPSVMATENLEVLAVGYSGLSIDDNFITAVSHAKALKELHLHDVRISALPKNLYMLPSLEILDIRYTSLKEIMKHAETLQQLKNLKEIRLYGVETPESEIKQLKKMLPNVLIDYVPKSSFFK